MKKCMNQAAEYALNFSCVAHLYALFNNELNDAVSDTTKEA